MRRLIQLSVICSCLGLAVLVCLTWIWQLRCITYGYPSLLIEFHFVDSNGKPVQGVSLRVEDHNGNPCYRFPVTDFTPEHMPTSDREGKLTFHHVGVYADLTTFPGKRRLFGITPPVYYCRFFKDGQEIYACTFHDLYLMSRTHEETQIEKDWDWSCVFGEHVAGVLSDCNGYDDEIQASYELSLAKRKGVRQTLYYQMIKDTFGRTVEKRTFVVVRMRIVVGS